MRLLFLSLLLSTTSLLAVGGFSDQVAMDPESRDTLSVTSFMDNVPSVGFMPLKVVIDNRSTSNNSWSLNPDNLGATADWIDATWSFPVQAGSRAEFDILVPLKTANFTYRWGAQFNWSGPGVDSGRMQLPQTSKSTSASLPFVGMSDSLHAKHWGTLQSQNADLSGTALDLSQAPADWRAYIGLDQIWMTSQEWLALPVDQKFALLEAITFGSHLALVCASATDAAQVRDSFKLTSKDAIESWQQGGGRVRLLVGSANLDAPRILDFISSAPSKSDLLNNHRLSPFFNEAVAAIGTAGPLVLLFIVLFGIVAGPVNLFVLAPSGRRHRLFITTPLISLVGALVLAAAIFIQDGTGGSGTRLLHVQVLPDQKRLLIQQEQTSRTGLLFSTRFTLPDSTWLQPLSGTGATPSFNRTNQRYTLAANGACSGDWFRSRTRQSHLIHAVQPSRAAIEFSGGAQPSIISTIEVPLKDIYVRDPDGTLWRGKNVQPGTRTSLTREISGMDWWKAQISDHQLSGIMRAAAEAPAHSNGSFYATAADPGSLPIETLPSIRWQTPLVLLSGPLTLK